MNDSIILLDPTAELSSAHREKLPRVQSLENQTIGLLDISKARGDIFLDRLEEQLKAAGARVNRYKKPTFARIASSRRDTSAPRNSSASLPHIHSSVFAGQSGGM